jgi:hypothetical protein
MNGTDMTFEEPAVEGDPQISRILTFVLGLFSLDSILLT